MMAPAPMMAPAAPTMVPAAPMMAPAPAPPMQMMTPAPTDPGTPTNPDTAPKGMLESAASAGLSSIAGTVKTQVKNPRAAGMRRWSSGATLNETGDMAVFNMKLNFCHNCIDKSCGRCIDKAGSAAEVGCIPGMIVSGLVCVCKSSLEWWRTDTLIKQGHFFGRKLEWNVSCQQYLNQYASNEVKNCLSCGLYYCICGGKKKVRRPLSYARTLDRSLLPPPLLTPIRQPHTVPTSEAGAVVHFSTARCARII